MNEMENNVLGKGYLTVPLYERSFGVEASGDFTLPDYQNEIRRILHVSETVLPPAKYVGDDSVEFNGTVDYQVIYVGGDGGVYSVPLSSDYSFSVPIENGANADAIEDVCVLCSVSAESVNTRVSAPRRLSIRSRLRPNVRIIGMVSADCSFDEGASPNSIYRHTERCRSSVGNAATSDIINVTWSVPNTGEDTRVVLADAYVDVGEKRIGESSVNCRGEVKMKLLCISEDSGEYSVMEGSVPFEGEIDHEMGSDGECRARGYVSEMSVDVNEMGIECTAGIILEALGFASSDVEYTDDAYSTACESQCQSRALSVGELLTCKNANMTVSERMELSATSVPEGAELICSVAKAIMDKCELSGDKYVFGGNAVFTVFYRKDGDVYATDVSVPVRYETEAPTGVAVTAFDATADIGDIRAKIADGNLCIDAEMRLSADCFGVKNITAVERVSFGEPISRTDSELTVCYPAPDDTLWSVAKRYRTAPTGIIGDPATDRYVMVE